MSDPMLEFVYAMADRSKDRLLDFVQPKLDLLAEAHQWSAPEVIDISILIGEAVFKAVQDQAEACMEIALECDRAGLPRTLEDEAEGIGSDGMLYG